MTKLNRVMLRFLDLASQLKNVKYLKTNLVVVRYVPVTSLKQFFGDL